MGFATRSSAALLMAALLVLVSSCGGGGGGGGSSNSPGVSAPPIIQATLLSFPTGSAPPNVLASGFNSAISVNVLDQSTGAPITNATVSFNGIAVPYSSTQQAYFAEINVQPAGAVSVSVSLGGTNYTASGNQVNAYPTISAPVSGASWYNQAANLISWSGVAPSSESQWLVGVIDSSGNLQWPSGGAFQAIGAGATESVTVSGGQLTAGSDDVLVGLANVVNIAGAASPSGLAIVGLTYSAVTISNTPPPPAIVSVTVVPVSADLAIGGTLQLTATATYSDNSTRDVTAQATWSSTLSSTVSVGSTGSVTGLNYGTATIRAAMGSVHGDATMTVFQPTPSPVPPLGQTVAYQIDYVHSGSGTFASSIVFPSSPAWTATLSGAASYPIIAGGMVIVTAADSNLATGTNLYALNEQTGAIVWGPINITANSNWSTIAYDHGNIFLVNGNRAVMSFNATNGAQNWSTSVTDFIAGLPTAVNGILYVPGFDSSGSGVLYAIDESNGNILWSSSVVTGEGFSPAVASDGVYVTGPCQAYKFDPTSGATIWHYDSGCSGSFGGAPVVANGYVYDRDASSTSYLILDATSGAFAGTFPISGIPAISGTVGYFRIPGTGLVAMNVSSPASLTNLWTFAGDGGLDTPPIVLNHVVFIASSSGNVYALNAATGTQLWSANAGAAIPATNENVTSTPTSSLGAGDGYLIVPAGNGLTAWYLQ